MLYETYNFDHQAACRLTAIKLAQVLAKQHQIDILVLWREDTPGERRKMRDCFTGSFYVHPNGEVDTTMQPVL